MDFSDIPLFPRAHYEVDVPWEHLESHLKFLATAGVLNLSPDYQRAHVWTKEQQQAYVEYVLRGGEVGKTIIWNSPQWGKALDSNISIDLVDGKQRLEAVLSFLQDRLPVFGHLRSEIKGLMRVHIARFSFRICALETRKEVLQLYLNINAGGTPHTEHELSKVRKLLEKES